MCERFFTEDPIHQPVCINKWSVRCGQGLGLQTGAVQEDAHAVRIEALKKMHEELRSVSLNRPLSTVVEQPLSDA